MSETLRGSLRIVGVPYALTQSPVLDTRAFIREAKEWGHALDINLLEELNYLGLLVPFFRVDDETRNEFAIGGDGRDLTRLAQYARAGNLRDPMLEDRGIRWTYRTPEGSTNWWDGFYYGRWQLLGVGGALTAHDWIRHMPSQLVPRREYAAQTRAEQLAITVLSDRFLPSILGLSTYPAAVDREAVLEARYTVDARERLAASEVSADRLRPIAEFMLGHARVMDPMAKWWDLIRHAGHDGWSRLSGAPREAVWWRIGAEVLLRAHEELATEGLVEPLPDLVANPRRVRHDLEDRPGQPPGAPSLERSLATFGLSPHPRVLLVVEGESERLYIGALLEELGLGDSHLVRLIVQGSSADKPWQLVPLVVPRLGEIRGERRMLDSMPTALVIAMDPENHWRTQADVDRQRIDLQSRLAKQVATQGSTLTADELDVLVQARNWGEFTFELANFTDAELETALLSIATRMGLHGTESPGWETDLRHALADARRRRMDIKVVFARMQWPEHKIVLAEELMPVLVSKLYHDQHDPDRPPPPVVQLVYDIQDTVERLSGPGYSIAAASQD